MPFGEDLTPKLGATEMLIACDTKLEKHSNRILLAARSKVRSKFVALIVAALAVLVVSPHFSGEVSALGAIIAAFVTAAALYVLVPRHFETVIDIDNHVVTLRKSWLSDRFSRSWVLPGTSVAGLGLKEYKHTDGGGRSYLPVLVETSGKLHHLATQNGSALEYGSLISELCGLTGIPRHDLPAD